MLFVGGPVSTLVAGRLGCQPGDRGAHPAGPADRADGPVSLMGLGDWVCGMCGGFPGLRAHPAGGGLRAALAALGPVCVRF